MHTLRSHTMHTIARIITSASPAARHLVEDAQRTLFRLQREEHDAAGAYADFLSRNPSPIEAAAYDSWLMSAVLFRDARDEATQRRRLAQAELQELEAEWKTAQRAAWKAAA